MSIEEIRKTLDEFVRSEFEIDDDPDYATDVNLFDMGFVDSLGATMILRFAEETFGVKITQKDISLYPMNTVDEIAEVIAQKI